MTETTQDVCQISAIFSEPQFLKDLKFFFQERNFPFWGFSNSAQAIQDMYQQNHVPDIILLDQPVNQALETAGLLHADKALCLVPIILLLPPEPLFDTAQLIQIGAADFLSKPFQASQLMNLIHKHQQTRQKWWQTFHIDGLEARENVPEALNQQLQAQQALKPISAALPDHLDDFQHFKSHLYARLQLSNDRIQRLKNYSPDEVYQLAEDLDLSSIQMAAYIAEFLKLETRPHLRDYVFNPGLIPFQFCQKNFIVPLKDRFSHLHIAVANPFQLEVIDILNRLFKSYHLILVAPQLILQVLDPTYANSQEFQRWLQAQEHSKRFRAMLTHAFPPPLKTVSDPASALSLDTPEVAAQTALSHASLRKQESELLYGLPKEPLPVALTEEDLLKGQSLDMEPLNTASEQQSLQSSVQAAEAMEKRLLRAYQAYRDQKLQPENPLPTLELNHLLQDKDPEIAPIIYLVNSLIEKAYLVQASDIHIEPSETEVVIRYRIDGVLKVMHRLQPSAISKPMIARLKIMSELDISEKRLPQDGRIHFQSVSEHGAIDIDLRLSVVPLQFGEKAVLRLLDHNRNLEDLDNMGFSKEALHLYRKKINAPYGLILHVGPTGSGKTTTMYSALNELNAPDINIHTIEDPIEYTLNGINQLEVRHDIGLNFSRALRAYLRQDPDIILVGEIRDDETAHIAIEAAMTGHLLYSTLHTNDAASTVIRLLEMGIRPYMLTASLLMICAQRLVRRLCESCKTPYLADEGVKKLLGLPGTPSVTLYEARGCEECEQSGYRGRIGIYELLIPDERLRKLMNIPEISASELKRAAIQSGMKTLFQDGIEKALQGLTSLEEITLKILSDE